MAKHYMAWRWRASTLRGVLALGLGVLSLISPAVTFMSVVLLFGVYAIFDGVLALSMSKRTCARGDAISRGVVSLAAGIVTLAWPTISAFALIVVISAWAITSGFLEIVGAIRMRKYIDHEWLLVLEGALSLGFGVLLALAPLAVAKVLGLWVGAYALVLGIVLLAIAFETRRTVRPARSRMTTECGA